MTSDAAIRGTGEHRVTFGVIANPKTYGWYKEWLPRVEDAGFAMVTTGDSQSLWADPFVTLSVAAHVTSHARLAITVSNPRTRHPAATTAALASVDQLAPGRVVYGIGSGDSSLKNIGLPPGKSAEVADYARAVKALAAGDVATWDGRDLRSEWTRFDLPVWMAAEGPRMQFLAGQCADGVLMSNALDAGVLRKARENLAAGAASVGRDPEEIEVWCLAAMCFAPSEQEGVHQLRSLLAGTANHVYRFHLDGKDVPDEYRAALVELKEGYDYRHHASPATAEENATLVERLGLVDFLAARSVIAGTPSQCVERIRSLRALGVNRLLIHHHANEPFEFMDTFATSVGPQVATLPSGGPS